MKTINPDFRNGFTFVELITVIALLSLIALFTAKMFVNDIAEKRAEQLVGDILTVATTSQSYFMENGQWPSDSDDCAGLFAELNGEYFSGINTTVAENRTEFSCASPDNTDFKPTLLITWEMPNDDVAQIVDQMLPLSSPADAQDEENNPINRVAMAVPAPSIAPTGYSVFRIATLTQGDEFNPNCGNGSEPVIISETSNGYCYRGNGGVNGYAVMPVNDRYRVYVKRENGEVTESNVDCGFPGGSIEISILYRCQPEEG